MKKVNFLMSGIFVFYLTSCAAYNNMRFSPSNKWHIVNFSGSHLQDKTRGYEMRFENKRTLFSVQNTPKWSFYQNMDEKDIEVYDVQQNRVIGHIQVQHRYETQLNFSLNLADGTTYTTWIDDLYGEVLQENKTVFKTRVNGTNGLEIDKVQSLPNEEILEAAFLMQKKVYDNMMQFKQLELQRDKIHNPYRPGRDVL